MTRNPPNPIVELPKGIQRVWRLPAPELGAMWNSIVMDEERKAQLLSQAVVNFTVRPKVARTVLPLHGVILLVGPPGTGKTTLAKGLAHRVAESFKTDKMRLLEVEPHALTSSAPSSIPERRVMSTRSTGSSCSASTCRTAIRSPGAL